MVSRLIRMGAVIPCRKARIGSGVGLRSLGVVDVVMGWRQRMISD